MNNQRQLLASVMLMLMLVSTVYLVKGDPTGVSFLTNETLQAGSATPDSRADPPGTITVVSIDVLQQNFNWKGYVGNVSGRLTLDDANGFTIYDWEILGAVSGEVYVARNDSPRFGNVSCATNFTVQAEDTFLGLTSTSSDSINNTYNYSEHPAITIGGNVNGTNPLVADSCKSTATFVNDTRQNLDGNQAFTSVVAQDQYNNTIFITVIDDNEWGFNNNVTNFTINKTYDFQLIVPDNATSSGTTYYFWTELDG